MTEETWWPVEQVDVPFDEDPDEDVEDEVEDDPEDKDEVVAPDAEPTEGLA